MSDTIVIPDDLKSCQTLIDELINANAKQSKDIDSHINKIDELTAEMEKLRKLLSQLVNGPRSEKRILSGPNQAWLPFENEEELKAAQAEAEAEAEKIIEEYTVKRHARKKKPRSEALPAHLPRVEKIADVPEEMKNCVEHGERKIIGYDITETLVREPPKLYVVETKYPKFACSGNPHWLKAIVTARALPLRLSRPSGPSTCPSIVIKTSLPAVAGLRVARLC